MRRYLYSAFGALGFILLFRSASHAQLFDSLSAKAGLEYHFSSEGYQPFWLISNRYGTVTDRKSDLVSSIRIANKHVLAETETQNNSGLYDYNDFSLSYGLSLYNNNHFRSTFIEEAYAKLEYKHWSLRGGRFEETSGDLDPQLSSGSFGISPNALPIPKIGIAVTDYTNVPFTNGWLQFKGSFAHGWLGNNRYVKNSYYHEKTFFLRAGAGNLKFYAGVEHFAEWGGHRDNLPFGKTMKDFWDVFFIKESTPDTENGLHNGDHRGVLDGGIYWENSDFSVHGYIQKPFEGKNDVGLKTLNGLAGAEVSFKDKNTGLQKLLLEVIDTRNINYNIIVTKRESYYNNSIYKTGWEYQNNVIGTPLFINRTRGANYFPGIAPFNWDSPADSIPSNSNIINNRVFAIHAGALYSVSDQLDSKTLITYTKNFGSSLYSDLFSPGKTHIYCLQQFSYELYKYNLNINAAVGLDFGQLNHNNAAGIMLGVQWTLPVHQDTDNQ